MICPNCGKDMSEPELAEARELLRDLFNDATDARRVDEYRARGEERIPAFISVEYLDRVLAAIDAARKGGV